MPYVVILKYQVNIVTKSFFSFKVAVFVNVSRYFELQCQHFERLSRYFEKVSLFSDSGGNDVPY